MSKRWKIGTPQASTATAKELKQEIAELSALAQRAENSGERVLAGAAHNLINAGLDQLKRH